MQGLQARGHPSGCIVIPTAGTGTGTGVGGRPGRGRAQDILWGS